MATQTPRFSLNKYSDGDDNWTHSDTVDKIDEFAIDRGVVADRPNSGSYDGELYFATDEDILYRWDSGTSSWEERFYAKSSTPTWTGKHSFDSGISLNGNTIENIGGTTDASSGAIRLGNGSNIRARNVGDSADLGVAGTDNSDSIFYGSQGNYSTIELGDNLGGKINANNNIDLNSNSITNAASVSTGDALTDEFDKHIRVRPRITGGSGAGTSPPPASNPYTFDESIISDYVGLVRFGEGAYETSGLLLDTDEDYESGATYFEGDGVRQTELYHEDGTVPTIKFQTDGSTGNFGGVKNMSVFGAGKGTGSANIIESDANIIDLIFENLIVRYGGGAAIRLDATSSGCRLRNLWLENTTGPALDIQGGTRLKLNNIHSTGCDGNPAFYLNIDESEIAGISCFNAGSTAFEIDGQDNHLAGLNVKNPSGNGIIANSRNVYDGPVVDGAGGHAIRVDGDHTRIHGAEIANTSLNMFQVNASNCVITGTAFSSGETVEIPSGETNNILWLQNVDQSNITDNGDYNLINGVGSESASAETPSSSWPVGAVVDFTDSGDGSGTGVYKRLLDGTWTQIGS